MIVKCITEGYFEIFVFSFSAATNSASAELRRSRMLNFIISKDVSHEATHGSVETSNGEAASIRGQQRLGSLKKQS